jgi:hypothetical protein
MAGNSEKTAKPRRGPGRPFKKGESGNPSGRKPVPENVKEALKALTPFAVRRLGELIEDDNGKVAVTAVKEVLDRNLGKAPQTLELANKDGKPFETRTIDPSKLTTDQLRNLRELIALATASARA